MTQTDRHTDSELIAVAYRNGFIVDLSHHAGEGTGQIVANEPKDVARTVRNVMWLRSRATEIAGSA